MFFGGLPPGFEDAMPGMGGGGMPGMGGRGRGKPPDTTKLYKDLGVEGASAAGSARRTASSR